MKSVNIGLIGLGTIGRGVYDVIENSGELISKRTGISLSVKAVCDSDKKALEEIDNKNILKTSLAEDIINNSDIDIIVELIGGIEPARGIVLNALKNGKHVVTANKALLSGNWNEIFKAAAENEVFVNFEASVGGAIPIIRTLCMSFVADNIQTVYGILNGTTNFILTEMSEKGCSFDAALKVAQEKGIAESDPDLDISGADSAHKLAILALLGFGVNVSGKDVYTEGISLIGSEDICNAADWGYSIKLLAIAKDVAGGLELRVHPTLMKSSHLLSGVKGADNAVFVKGDLIGESLLFGKGAGRKPTSSSVVGDIVEIARRIVSDGGKNSLPYNFCYMPEGKKISCIEDLMIPYYLRFSVIDKPGVLAGISSILADNEISIANVSQKERKEGETVPVVILTHKAKEGNMRKAIEKINNRDSITAKTVVIRIEE
ncbi:MAG: homoserine dehydrogenase [Candidatus Omnitrophica bacterium]|nr:homoserine dehydrogenase [Candidatus Omnitrophota bacterium]